MVMMMRKFCLVVLLVVFGGSSGAWATSVNPLDDGGWEIVAHISNQGGMFDGNGDLDPSYSYGAFVSNPGFTTPDFQRVFPFEAGTILFITGDRTVWAIADFAELQSLITARGNDFTPNLELEIGVDGTISNVIGNVLSRSNTEDPWITLKGSHFDGYTNEQFIWGENDYGSFPEPLVLKNSRGGMDVFIRPIPEPNTALLLGFGLVGLGVKRRQRRTSHSGDGTASSC